MKFEIPPLGERSVSPQAINELGPPIGRIIVAWSLVDQSVNIWWRRRVKSLERQVDDKCRFARKLADIRRSHNFLNAPSEYRNFERELIRRVRNAQKVRDVLAHGALSHWTSDEGGIAVFTKIKHEENGPVLHDKSYRLAEIQAVGDTLADLGRDLHVVAFPRYSSSQKSK